MSLQYDSLHDALEAMRRDLDSYNAAVVRFVSLTAESMAAAEQRESDLRDDLHAVANRVEALTRLSQAHGAALGKLTVDDAA